MINGLMSQSDESIWKKNPSEERMLNANGDEIVDDTN